MQTRKDLPTLDIKDPVYYSKHYTNFISNLRKFKEDFRIIALYSSDINEIKSLIKKLRNVRSLFLIKNMNGSQKWSKNCSNQYICQHI